MEFNMFCPFCGKETLDGAVFCPSCGRQMPKAQQAQAPAQPAVEAPPVQPVFVAQPPIQPDPEIPSGPIQEAPVQPEYVAQPPVQPVFEAQPPVQPVQAEFTPPPAQPGFTPQGAPQAASSPPPPPAKKPMNLKVIIIAAAAVVVLGGGFAAAWFGGVFDSIFPSSSQTTTTSSVSDKDSAKDSAAEADGEEATTTSQATTKATEAAIDKSVAADPQGGDGMVFLRKQSSGMSEMFRALNIDTHVSDDPTPKGAVEELVVNMTSAVFGSVRNISMEETARGGEVFGMDIDLAFDFTDNYSKELMTLMFGEYGDPQYFDILKLVGASELNIELAAGGEIDGDNLNPVVSLNADWNVLSKPFLSLFSYFDLKEMLFSVPAITNRVFFMESTILPLPADSFTGLQSQFSQLEGVGEYIDRLMPYISKILIEAVNELNVTYGGEEELKLAEKTVKLEAIDVELDEESALKAVLAALNYVRNSPEIKGIVLEVYNEVLVDMAEMPPLDAQMMDLALDSAIAQMVDQLEYAGDSDVFRLRIYMNDGVLAGVVLADPQDSGIVGFVSVENAGYAFWYNDIRYSEYDQIADLPPTYKDTMLGDRYEIYGTMNTGGGGVSGDLRLRIREDEDVFDAKLLTYSNLDMSVMLGMPMLTGSFTVKMADLLSAFDEEQCYSPIYFVRQIAYSMEAIQDISLLQNLEFTLELIASDREYQVQLSTWDPSYKSGMSLSFKTYLMNKTIKPLSGDRIDVNNIEDSTLMLLMMEINSSVYAKLDELTAMGFDVEWLKPMIAQAMMGQAGGIDSPPVYDGFGEDGDGEYGDYGDYEGYEGDDGYGGDGYEGDNGYPYNPDDDFIFPQSSDEILDYGVLEKMPIELLQIARNEIYARHGWVFTNMDLQLYFNQKEWYVPLYDNASITLNWIEEANVELIAYIESMLDQ